MRAAQAPQRDPCPSARPASGWLETQDAHLQGPDERLEIDTVKKITGMMSIFLAGQAGKDTFVALPPKTEVASAAPPKTTKAEGMPSNG